MNRQTMKVWALLGGGFEVFSSDVFLPFLLQLLYLDLMSSKLSSLQSTRQADVEECGVEHNGGKLVFSMNGRETEKSEICHPPAPGVKLLREQEHDTTQRVKRKKMFVINNNSFIAS